LSYRLHLLLDIIRLLSYLAARDLSEKGISSLRLFMYNFSPNTRNLLDCTLETHVEDFDAVIAELPNRGVKRFLGLAIASAA
jgi:hypothetical protein